MQISPLFSVTNWHINPSSEGTKTPADWKTTAQPNMERTHSYSFWADFNIFSTIIEICIGAKIALHGSVIELLSRFCFILIDCPFLLFYQGEYVCYFFIDRYCSLQILLCFVWLLGAQQRIVLSASG